MSVFRIPWINIMPREQKVILNLVERKALYQKHRLIGTLISGLALLALILLLTPHEETFVINSQSIISHSMFPVKGDRGIKSPAHKSSPGINAVNILGGNIAPAGSYRLIPDNYANRLRTPNIANGPFLPHQFDRPDNYGSPGALSCVSAPHGETDPWPIDNTRSGISALNSYDLNLTHSEKSNISGGPSNPIRILFYNSARILPPRETRNIVDTAIFDINLIVKENGSIPKDGIKFISFFPPDLPERYLDLYRENICNLLRTEAFIEPAVRYGTEITDSTFLKIVYLEGSGGLTASNTRNVEIIW